MYNISEEFTIRKLNNLAVAINRSAESNGGEEAVLFLWKTQGVSPPPFREILKIPVGIQKRFFALFSITIIFW